MNLSAPLSRGRIGAHMHRRDCLHAVAGLSLGLPMLSAAAKSDTQVLRASDVHPANYPTVLAQQWLGQQLNSASDGRLQLKMYHSGQLGKEADTLDLVRFGGLDFSRVFLGSFTNSFPAASALCLPFVIDDALHMRRVIDGKVGDRILQSFAARGLVGLAIYDSGARSLYSRKPILHPDALRGLKIRSPSSDLFIDMLAAMGANPTPLAYGAVYSALETGLIDGAENNLRSFNASLHVEAAPCFNLTQHSFAPDVLLMSKRRFDSLANNDREMIVHYAKQSVAVMRQAWDQGEQEALAAIKAANGKLLAVDRSAFQRLSTEIVQRYAADPEVRALLAVISQLRA